MDNLTVGEITSKELVNYFGTDKQKEKINNGKYLGGREKDLLLIKAQKFCNIEDLTQGKYLIHKVYDIEEDDLILPLTKGLNKYLTPLILSNILEESEDDFKLTLSFLGWAKKFEMINNNYSVIKYNQEKSCRELNIDPDTMYEYFEKIDDCIKYYIDKCLTILKEKEGLELIDVESVTMVKKFFIDPNSPKSGFGLEVQCDYDDDIISDEDRKFVYECEREAKEKAGITRNNEKYYGVKSFNYRNELRKLLSKRNILFTYEAYNIYCKDIKETKRVLETFKDINNNPKEFISLFNEKFIEYIERKATNRHNKEIEKQNDGEKSIKSYRMLQKYISDYQDLSKWTINQNAEDILDRLKLDEMDTMREFNVKIIKKYKNNYRKD